MTDAITKIRERIEKLAKKQTRDEDGDFCPMDWFGGNFDDAYNGGKDDGHVELAKELMAILNEYK